MLSKPRELPKRPEAKVLDQKVAAMNKKIAKEMEELESLHMKLLEAMND